MSPLPKSLTLDLVTPDKAIVHEEVDEVQLFCNLHDDNPQAELSRPVE